MQIYEEMAELISQWLNLHEKEKWTAEDHKLGEELLEKLSENLKEAVQYAKTRRGYDSLLQFMEEENTSVFYEGIQKLDSQPEICKTLFDVFCESHSEMEKPLCPEFLKHVEIRLDKD